MRRYSYFPAIAVALLLVGSTAAFPPQAGARRSLATSAPQPSPGVVSLASAAQVIRDYARETYASTYGGDVLAKDATEVDVFLTSLDSGTEDALVALAPTEAQSVIKFVQVARPEAALLAIQARILGDADTLSAQGIQLATWGPVLETNGFQVEVKDLTDAQKQYLQSTYGTFIDVESVASLPVAATDSRLPDSSPWNGGDFISDTEPNLVGSGSRYWDCTSGFPVHIASGTTYLLTAAHCFSLNYSVYNTSQVLFPGSASPSNLMGSVSNQDLRYGGFDAELIQAPSSSYVWTGGISTTTRATVAGAIFASPGTPVCVDGAWDGESCSYTTGSGLCITLAGEAGRANRYACGEIPATSSTTSQGVGSGDSGGPVWLGNSGAIYATGVISALASNPAPVTCSNWNPPITTRQCNSKFYFLDVEQPLALWSLSLN